MFQYDAFITLDFQKILPAWILLLVYLNYSNYVYSWNDILGPMVLPGSWGLGETMFDLVPLGW